MNQTYWAEKQKNQTQMLRVIHDQMHELEEDMHKVADTLGRVGTNMNEATKSFIQNHKSVEIHSQRIDLLVKRIDILSYAVAKWAPITVKKKKEFEKAIKPKKKKAK